MNYRWTEIDNSVLTHLLGYPTGKDGDKKWLDTIFVFADEYHDSCNDEFEKCTSYFIKSNTFQTILDLIEIQQKRYGILIYDILYQLEQILELDDDNRPIPFDDLHENKKREMKDTFREFRYRLCYYVYQILEEIEERYK